MAADPTTPTALPPRVLLDPAICKHMIRAIYATRIVCCQCEKVLEED